MGFLDHRSLDETQKYIDHLIAHTEQENASIMAPFERAGVTTAVLAPMPRSTSVGTAVATFRRNNS